MLTKNPGHRYRRNRKKNKITEIRDSEFTLGPLLLCLSKIKLLSLVLLFSKNVLGKTAKLGATETTTLSNPQLINRLAVGFSVISLTINIPMLEIRLESIQPTQLRQKC